MHQTVLNDTLLDSLKTQFDLFQAKGEGIFSWIPTFEKKIYDSFCWYGMEGKTQR